jgi:hypothetical protein
LNSTPSPTNGWTLTRFFVPLAIQAASQALSYPLVAMVASRGAGGPVNLAGLAQANVVMFFFGMFAISYVTTGMVYAKTREGYQKFRLVTLMTGLMVIAIQAILCMPVPSHLLFGKIIGLPPSIESPARITFLISIPLQYFFFLRVPYFVVMYIGKATGKASLATIVRLMLTASLSPLFCLMDLVGPIWAVVCLTLPVAIEVVVSRMFASPFLKALEQSSTNPPRAREIFFFNLPLSLGGYFLSVSAIVLASFIARAPDPDRILPVYYLALGLANPLAFAATRIQTIVIAFPPQSLGDHRTLRFSLAAGAIMGTLPLVFTLPGLAEFYYVGLQRLDPKDLHLVRMTAIALIFFPFSVAVRAQSEGLAAWLKKPTTVMAGHALFLATIILTGSVLLFINTPGQLIGPAGLTLGSLASSATIRIALVRMKEKSIPVGQTTTSVGQIR